METAKLRRDLLTVRDDVIIYGVGDTQEEEQEDHNIKLKKFLQRCSGKGVKPNKKNLKLQCKEISGMGHLITAYHSELR